MEKITISAKARQNTTSHNKNISYLNEYFTIMVTVSASRVSGQTNT